MRVTRTRESVFPEISMVNNCNNSINNNNNNYNLPYLNASVSVGKAITAAYGKIVVEPLIRSVILSPCTNPTTDRRWIAHTVLNHIVSRYFIIHESNDSPGRIRSVTLSLVSWDAARTHSNWALSQIGLLLVARQIMFWNGCPPWNIIRPVVKRIRCIVVSKGRQIATRVTAEYALYNKRTRKICLPDDLYRYWKRFLFLQTEYQMSQPFVFYRVQFRQFILQTEIQRDKLFTAFLINVFQRGSVCESSVHVCATNGNCKNVPTISSGIDANAETPNTAKQCTGLTFLPT